METEMLPKAESTWFLWTLLVLAALFFVVFITHLLCRINDVRALGCRGARAAGRMC